MEIKLTHNALLLKGKAGSLVVDPQTAEIEEEVETIIFSTSREVKTERLVISGPGEYEVKGVKIFGAATDSRTNYEIKMDGLKMAIISGKIMERYAEVFSDLDVLLLSLPLEGQNPQELVLKVEPKIVVVYNTQDAGPFLKDIGRENIIPTSRVVVKKDSLPQELEAVWLI